VAAVPRGPNWIPPPPPIFELKKILVILKNIVIMKLVFDKPMQMLKYIAEVRKMFIDWHVGIRKKKYGHLELKKNRI
jgi:hypothetical protein